MMGTEGVDPQLPVVLPEPLRLRNRLFIVPILHIGARVLIEAAALFVIAVILLLALQTGFSSKSILDPPLQGSGGTDPNTSGDRDYRGFQHARLPANASYHEVDELLYRLGRDHFDADGVILGNSVAYQVFNHPSFLERTNIAMLATNEAIGMTGQYFVMKRYLERNRPPRAVILITHPSLKGSLSNVTADNYLCRTFTRPREILDVLLLKRDPVFSLKGWLTTFTLLQVPPPVAESMVWFYERAHLYRHYPCRSLGKKQ